MMALQRADALNLISVSSFIGLIYRFKQLPNLEDDSYPHF
jgi:hypothetical protein